MERKIRKIEEADLRTFARINQRAYAGYFNGSNEELDAACETYRTLLSYDGVEGYGAFEGDKLIGGMIFYEFDFNFYGKMIKLAGIGSVAVDLLHKKEKVARDLILFSMDYAKERNIPLFALYPFRADFYRKFGFGYSNPLIQVKTAPQNFRDFGNKEILKEVDADSVDELIEYYNSVAKNTHGMTLKSDMDIKRFKGHNGATYLKAALNGEIIGYLVFNQKKINEVHGQHQKIEVLECLYSKPLALHAFSSFMNSQRDQVTYVEWHSFDEHIYRVLDQISYAPEERMMPLISQKFGDLGSGIMFSVLDAEKLLGLIFDGEVCPLAIKVRHVDGSEKRVGGKCEKAVDIQMTIQGLSTWLIGAATLEELKWAGEVKSQTDLSTIDKMLNLSKPYFYSRY